MPSYRRRPASIAKVNATSIDGYFGEGTPCFFIRGTILSDVEIEGEYRTLAIQRPGNLIDVESFDGEWAIVAITTRAGNRPGDNIKARLWLRDADLKLCGIDCERIILGAGAIQQPAAEPTDSFVPWPVIVSPTNGESNGYTNGHVDHVPAPEAVAAPLRPQPEPIPPAPVAPVPIEPATIAPELHATPVERVVRSPLGDGKLLIEVGASVVAVALPVVLYFLRALFAKKDE